VNITVTKEWDDADNQDGIRPESVTVRLLANGEPVEIPAPEAPAPRAAGSRRPQVRRLWRVHRGHAFGGQQLDVHLRGPAQVQRRRGGRVLRRGGRCSRGLRG
ncbi:MAG: Cna B-type domain-containing protein, partial [Atopobiaceae bacterium]|nr:Cna B-type domain-containing protein [Atopobiaceae bacterium]